MDLLPVKGPDLWLVCTGQLFGSAKGGTRGGSSWGLLVKGRGTYGLTEVP